MSDLRVDEDYRFVLGMAGCPWSVVRVAFAVGGVEELPWGRWLVVLDGSVSCYGGQPIVLRLWVSFLLCRATRRIGFGIVPDACLVLRTLGTGCLVALR